MTTSIAILLLLLAVAGVADPVLTNAPPTPPSLGIAPPPIPAMTPEQREATTNIVVAASAEWELTFEWVPELGSTNAVPYPIKIQVPFEHDSGFVYIRARKVEVKK